MREIELSQGKVALVDDEDFDYLNQFKWCVLTGNPKTMLYACRRLDKHTLLLMHCEIMDYKGIDHKDRNGLNNTRDNLRRASESQNRCNVLARSVCGYKGVTKYKNKWKARIQFEGLEHYLGLFETVEEAAKARDVKAEELHGEFAVLNNV